MYNSMRDGDDTILNSSQKNTVGVDGLLDMEFAGWIGEETRVKGAYKHPEKGKIPVLVERASRSNPILAELKHQHVSAFEYCASTSDAHFLAFADYPLDLKQILDNKEKMSEIESRNIVY